VSRKFAREFSLKAVKLITTRSRPHTVCVNAGHVATRVRVARDQALMDRIVEERDRMFHRCSLIASTASLKLLVFEMGGEKVDEQLGLGRQNPCRRPNRLDRYGHRLEPG
jgi:hypothetical protein